MTLSTRAMGFASICLLVACLQTVVAAAELDATGISGDLSVEQAVLADRYDRLEMVAARLAELSAGTDPRRARRLREAISRSRDLDVGNRFERTVQLLEKEQLAAAVQNQDALGIELSRLLELLLKDTRDREMKSEQQRIRKYLKEIGRLIRWQQGIRARTEIGDSADRLEEDQSKVAEQTGELGKEIDEVEGDGKSSDSESSEASDSKPSATEPSEPSDGTPSSSEPSSGEPSEGGQQGSPQDSQSPPEQQPMDRASEKLRKAAQQMEQAQQQLEKSKRDAKRDGAIDKQDQALANLEQARAELEKVLRQLREEELERTLTMLVARFRKMLEAQVAVYEGTLLVGEVPVEDRDHREEIESARLSRKESLIVRDADKALVLLKEEGSSVAFPEAVQQMREDMQQVVDRLATAKVGSLTQQIEQDIIEALEEAIAALEKAIEEMDDSKQQSKPPGAGGPPGEQPLVDKIAELKMIRSLQIRINRRTQRFDRLLAEEPDQAGDIYEALGKLSERQARVFQATKDLAQGRND